MRSPGRAGGRPGCRDPLERARLGMLVQHEVDVELGAALVARRTEFAHGVVAHGGPDGLRGAQQLGVAGVPRRDRAAAPLGRVGGRQEEPEPLVEATRHEPVDLAAADGDPGERRVSPG